MTTEVQLNNSAVEFATTMRVHVALAVSDLAKSLPFYRTLFNQEPTKLRPGYAKFEVAEPPVNLTLNEMELTAGVGNLSHLGIQVKSTAAVLNAKDRFVQAGLATFDEDNVTCCYAVQDKVWVTDPDGASWEFFVVTNADSEQHSANRKLDEVNCACSTGSNTLKTIPLTVASATSCC